jgi:phage-related protein
LPKVNLKVNFGFVIREVKFYATSTGRSPIEEFLDTLSAKQAQKVTWTLNLLEEMESVPTQYFQKMVNTDDLWEVRVKAGSNIFRLLGFFDGAKLVVLSHAFQKKTQKTPRQAIKLAEERKRDYFTRKKK